MPASDQRVSKDRYNTIPRTVIFLRHGESYLLIKGAPTKAIWAGRYNGLGGHVERGEDVRFAAIRELHEEAGLHADLWLCGVVIIDAGPAGVCLFVFTGDSDGAVLNASPEGTPEWIPYAQLGRLPVVEDVPILLERIHGMHRGDPPFFARSYYDGDGHLLVEFAT